MNRPWRVAIVRDGDNDALIRELTDRALRRRAVPGRARGTASRSRSPSRRRARARDLRLAGGREHSGRRGTGPRAALGVAAAPSDRGSRPKNRRRARGRRSQPPARRRHHGRRRRPAEAPARRAVLDGCPRAVPDRRWRTADADRGTPRRRRESSRRSRPIARRRWRQPTYRPPGLRCAPDAAIVGSGRSAQALIDAIGD